MHSPARFSVKADPARDAMHVELSGFFLPNDVDAFDALWWETRKQLRCATNEHLTLCDITEMSIQTREVVIAFTQIVRHPERRSRRLAMIVGASLSRQQAQRLPDPGRLDVRFFFERAEAEAWLFSDDRTSARYPHAPTSPRSDARDYIDRSVA